MKSLSISFLLIVALWLAGATREADAVSATDLSGFAFQADPEAKLPLDAALTDESSQSVTLAHYFTGVPVVLVLEYLQCRTFCGLTLSGVLRALDTLPIDAGRDYQFVAVSIDQRDTPADNAAAKAKYLGLYHHPNAASGIHFLAGTGPEVRRIADSIGFRYRYDPQVDQYIHPAGFVLATPAGMINQHIFGVAPPATVLKSGIADAARQQRISPLTRFFLLCHVEGVPIGRFTVPVLAALMIADIAAGICVIVLFISLWRRQKG